MGTGRRPYPANESGLAITRAMGNAIRKATNNKAVISFHPQPNTFGSAEYFHKEGWRAFNMFQTGALQGCGRV